MMKTGENISWLSKSNWSGDDIRYYSTFECNASPVANCASVANTSSGLSNAFLTGVFAGTMGRSHYVVEASRYPTENGVAFTLPGGVAKYPSACNYTAHDSIVNYDANGSSADTPIFQSKVNGQTLTLAAGLSSYSRTVSYNANGGSVSPSSHTITFTFGGWNTASNGSGTNYSAGGSYTTNASAKLYAKWNRSASLPTPTRTGYVFRGWFDVASGKIITNTTPITKNMALYALWGSNSGFTVYYYNPPHRDVNGNMSPITTNVTLGVSTALANNPFTMSGYHLLGWYPYMCSSAKWRYSNNATAGWYTSAPSNAYSKRAYYNKQSVSQTSTTLGDVIIMHAKWAPNEGPESKGYTVFYISGGASGDMLPTHAVKGIGTRLRANTFTYTGKQFIGWHIQRQSDNKYYYTNTSGTGGWYLEGQSAANGGPPNNTFSKRLYPDKYSHSALSAVNGDVIYARAQWQ